MSWLQQFIFTNFSKFFFFNLVTPSKYWDFHLSKQCKSNQNKLNVYTVNLNKKLLLKTLVFVKLKLGVPCKSWTFEKGSASRKRFRSTAIKYITKRYCEEINIFWITAALLFTIVLFVSLQDLVRVAEQSGWLLWVWD